MNSGSFNSVILIALMSEFFGFFDSEVTGCCASVSTVSCTFLVGRLFPVSIRNKFPRKKASKFGSSCVSSDVRADGSFTVFSEDSENIHGICNREQNTEQ